jgi:DNA transformation protein and related proteins
MTIPTDPLALTLELLQSFGRLRTRKMFGGVYIYCNDFFIATIHDGTLYLKANTSTADEFIQRKLRQFSYPKGGEIATLQYYEAPAEFFSSRLATKHWFELALRAAKQDHANKKRAK